MEDGMNKMMKKILVMCVAVSFLINTESAKASITDSSLFEPVLGCVVGGGAGYIVSTNQSPGNEIMFAAIFCGVGALTGILLNSHYSEKYGRVYQDDLAKMRQNVKMMELQQGLRAAHNEDDEFAIRLKKVVPGQKLPNGSVSAPTIIESLVPPGDTVRLNDGD
jgi:hypothetical protein